MLTAMITVAYALATSLQAQAPQPRKPIDLNWVYMNEHLKWKTPPKGTVEGVQYCENAFLAILFPSGEYVGVSPVLYRDDKTKRISISRGDGMVILKGRWTREITGLIRVTSRTVYTPLPQVGKHYPADERVEEWKPAGSVEGRVASKLVTPWAALVPLKNFADLEFLSDNIAVEGASDSG